MIQFLTVTAWNQIRTAARKDSGSADVAVAYFGKGACKLLPLKAGSRLVVDASEHAIKTGQTHPADLKALVNNGVQVFSVPYLHAKVFVFRSQAFVGSANASNRSTHTLIEAIVQTSDRKVVAAAKKFVRDHCLHELGPHELDRLQKIYKPPIVPSKRMSSEGGSKQPRLLLPRHFIARLKAGDPPQGSEDTYASGEKSGRSKMEHPRRHSIESFWCYKKSDPYKPGDLVTQVTDEGGRRTLVSAPGKVIHTEPWSGDREHCIFVYLEVPPHRRVQLGTFAKRLGRGSKKRLMKDGKASAEFGERVLAAWNR